jgi:hypothetical protein
MRRSLSTAVPDKVWAYTASQAATAFGRDVRFQLDGGTADDQFAVFGTDDPDTSAGALDNSFSPTNNTTWPPGAHTFYGIVDGASERRLPGWGPYSIAMRVGGSTPGLNLLASGLGELAEVTAAAPTKVGDYGDAISIAAIEGDAWAGFEDDAAADDAAEVYVTDKVITAGSGVPAGARLVGSISGGASGSRLKIPAVVTATKAVLRRTSGTNARRVRFSGQEAGDAQANLTTAERDALNPAPGTSVFNTTTGQLEVYDGTRWMPVIDLSRYGDGSAGDLVIGNGETVTLGAKTGIPYYASLTIAAGGTLMTNGLPVFCRGKVDIAGVVDASGGDASGATPGAHGGINGTAPGAGGDVGHDGKDALAQTISYVAGGGDGGGGATTKGGHAANPSGFGTAPRDATTLLAMLLSGGLCGASGGGGGGGDASPGGGGGGGAGPIVLVAPEIHLHAGAALKAKGGAGAAGTGPNAGGGGGGGASAIVLLTPNFTDDGAKFEVTGGTGGVAPGGGTKGANGSDGGALHLAY